MFAFTTVCGIILVIYDMAFVRDFHVRFKKYVKFCEHNINTNNNNLRQHFP